ncbi:alginate lyase family protein [Lacticaseibacillus daqingensis]|uniref:alginate lyase family protein n=1 Tax=Lacticaseibacillus daqingensis TaxID=2486014 RepID=UPI000F77A9BA|nr:alginate lyase family protein [Lacticaseibacillus daqingensis]
MTDFLTIVDKKAGMPSFGFGTQHVVLAQDEEEIILETILAVKAALQAQAEKRDLAGIGDLLTQEDRQAICHRADQLLTHTFTFDKTWDMERCLTPYQLEPLDYSAIRNDDPEWCFMLNRMDWLSDLMLAGVITGNKAYYQAGIDDIMTWLDQHPVIQPQNSTRTLDTGIRLVNIVDALVYLNDAHQLTDQALQRIVAHLLAQASYLRDQYIPKYKTSNWGSIQTASLLMVLPILDPARHEQGLLDWAGQELQAQVSLQVLDDGMQWEQSTMYHVEVLNYLLRVIACAEGVDAGVIAALRPAAVAMTRALLLTLPPTGELEPFGDTDRIPAQDVFDRAALILGGQRVAGYTNATLDLEDLYWLGANAARRFSEIATGQPDAMCFDGTDSGNFAIRSSWRPDADFLFFNHGPLGSGHGHSDNGHVAIYGHGQPLLVDSGRFTYREDHPLRAALKAMPAHNVVMIDDDAPSQPDGSWGYLRYGTPLKPYVRHRGQVHYLEGTLISDHPLSVWTRKIVMLPGSVWVITDEVHQAGHHEMTQRFHLDPTVTATTEGDRVDLNDDWQLLNPGRVAVTTGPFSPRYNELTDHAIVQFDTAFDDCCAVTTILAPKAVAVEAIPICQNLETPVPEQEGSAWRIRLSAQESYSVGIFHRELFRGKKIYGLDGVPFHAQVAVVHRTGEDTALLRIKL